MSYYDPTTSSYTDYGLETGTNWTRIIMYIVIFIVILVAAYFAYTTFIDTSFSIWKYIPFFGGGAPEVEEVPSYIGDTTSPHESRKPISSVDGTIEAPIPQLSDPTPPPVTVTSASCPACPPCNMDCVCPEPKENACKSIEKENDYLKNMVRFISVIARRENAINSSFALMFPSTSVLSVPRVQQLNYEYNYLKNEFRKDRGLWEYMQNNFTKLTGIPSHNYQQIM